MGNTWRRDDNHSESKVTRDGIRRQRLAKMMVHNLLAGMDRQEKDREESQNSRRKRA